jgi:hypothetical protein
MSIVSSINNFKNNYVALNNAPFDEINQLPAVLFSQRGGSHKYGDMFLFRKFGIPQNNSIQLSSDITTHYTEDNVPLNDHWAIKPRVYTVSGLIGEKIYTAPKHYVNTVNKYIPNWLNGLSFVSPSVSSATSLLRSSAQAIEDSVNRYSEMAVALLNDYSPVTQSQSNQQFVLDKLETLMTERQLITVWTPYKLLDNMAIIDIIMTQSDTLYESTVEIKLQEWSYVSSTTRNATKSEKSLLVSQQQASETNTGVASTQSTDFNDTILYSMFYRN